MPLVPLPVIGSANNLIVHEEEFESVSTYNSTDTSELDDCTGFAITFTPTVPVRVWAWLYANLKQSVNNNGAIIGLTINGTEVIRQTKHFNGDISETPVCIGGRLDATIPAGTETTIQVQLGARWGGTATISGNVNLWRNLLQVLALRVTT